MALCSLENKDARARFGILKGLHSARRGREPRCTRTAAQRDINPTGAHTGCVVTAGTRRRGHESRTVVRARGAPEGLDWIPGIDPPPGSDERRRDVTGRTRRPLPQNGIVRVPNVPAGTDPCMSGSDAHGRRKSGSHKVSKADIHLPVYESARVTSVQLGSGQHL